MTSSVNPWPHPFIAREGWPFLALAIAPAALVHWAAGAAWAAPLWVIALFVLQFFRDPARPVPGGTADVLSPADGRVIVVERAQDPYVGREALKISVFMNVFNVHSNRVPIDATVVSVDYKAGKFLNADLDKASEANERNALVLRRADGAIVTCVQVAGLIARRILCYVQPGDELARGRRFGFIRFGSRVDVYLPLTARPRVSIGQKVSASATVLAELA